MIYLILFSSQFQQELQAQSFVVTIQRYKPRLKATIACQLLLRGPSLQQFFYKIFYIHLIHKLEMRVGILIAIFLICVLSQQGSQRRRLFYSTTDHVCRSGPPGRKDLTYINALIYDEKDDPRRIKVVADGGSLCDSLVRDPRRSIMAVEDWDYLYYNHDRKNVTWFRFNQTIQKEYEVFSKLLKSIVVTSTVFNPCTIEDKLYDCDLIDSGWIDHFGIYEDYSASVHELICKSVKKQLESE